MAALAAALGRFARQPLSYAASGLGAASLAVALSSWAESCEWLRIFTLWLTAFLALAVVLSVAPPLDASEYDPDDDQGFESDSEEEEAEESEGTAVQAAPPVQPNFLVEAMVRRQRVQQRVQQLLHTPLEYGPGDEALHSLAAFAHLARRSQCLFAPKARVWGSPDWLPGETIEDAVERACTAFAHFAVRSRELKLDGFVVELPDRSHGATLEAFSEAAKRALRILSRHDPHGADCMADDNIGRRGWYFQYLDTYYFVTSFAPCYPETSARFNYGLDSSFLLFQPSHSFGPDGHNLPEDHPDDDSYKTIRQVIRNNFRSHGRGYYVPPRFHPLAQLIVRPLDDAPFVEWWLSPEERLRRLPIVKEQHRVIFDMQRQQREQRQAAAAAAAATSATASTASSEDSIPTATASGDGGATAATAETKKDR